MYDVPLVLINQVRRWIKSGGLSSPVVKSTGTPRGADSQSSLVRLGYGVGEYYLGALSFFYIMYILGKPIQDSRIQFKLCILKIERLGLLY